MAFLICSDTLRPSIRKVRLCLLPSRMRLGKCRWLMRSISVVRRDLRASWELKFELDADPVTDRRRIRYVSFKGTKHDAEIELARLVAENATGAGIDPSKVTVSEFFYRWDRDWAVSNVEGKTLE